jgi:hypothetical protein
MQDLTLVGLNEDSSRLVLVSDSGEEYTLPVDARLRAALRGDHARLGQLEKKMDSALRPRDIQARIRAGESPDCVAEAAQTTVDRIMTYASPVLAERAHIAERAQRASLRRRAGEGPARVLADAVAEQLRSRNVDPDTVDWDSWRREDGRWTLVADFRAGDRSGHAEFVFDVQGRYVVAEDDEARWLVGEQVAQRPAPPRPAGSGGPARRLSAVTFEEELPLGDDAIELVTGTETGAEGGADESTVDLTQTARELRGRTPTRADELSPAGDADWMATQASDRPSGVGSLDAPENERLTGDAETEQQPAAQEERPPEEEQPAAQDADPAPKKTGRKGRRASVPSWDEIMFGGGRTE